MLVNPFLRTLDTLYTLLIKLGSNLQSLFLLYMRLTWGHQFFINGLKERGFTGGLEIVGGILLIIGFASRLIAIPLMILMFTILGTVHAEPLSQLRFITEPFILVHQAPYPFLITSILVFVFGPGWISVDGWIKRWIEKQPKY